MVEDLACSIAAIAKTVKGGILIFYPSYALMNKCYEQWGDSGSLNLIQKHKVIY